MRLTKLSSSKGLSDFPTFGLMAWRGVRTLGLWLWLGLVAGEVNCRSLGFARDDKEEGGRFQWELIWGIPGLKSETWGTLRFYPLLGRSILAGALA
jgi:hypothetical protein